LNTAKRSGTAHDYSSSKAILSQTVRAHPHGYVELA